MNNTRNTSPRSFASLPDGTVFTLMSDSYRRETGIRLVSIRGRVWLAVERENVNLAVEKGHPLFGRKLKKESATVAHIIGRNDERSHIILNPKDRVSA